MTLATDRALRRRRLGTGAPARQRARRRTRAASHSALRFMPRHRASPVGSSAAAAEEAEAAAAPVFLRSFETQRITQLSTPGVRARHRWTSRINHPSAHDSKAGADDVSGRGRRRRRSSRSIRRRRHSRRRSREASRGTHALLHRRRETRIATACACRPFDAASSVRISVTVSAARLTSSSRRVIKRGNALPQSSGVALSAFLRPVGDAIGGPVAAGDESGR